MTLDGLMDGLMDGPTAGSVMGLKLHSDFNANKMEEEYWTEQVLLKIN